MSISVRYLFITGQDKNIHPEVIQLINKYNNKFIEPTNKETYINRPYIKFNHNDFYFQFNKQTGEYDIVPEEELKDFLKGILEEKSINEIYPTSNIKQYHNTSKYFDEPYKDYNISQLVDSIINDQSLRYKTKSRNHNKDAYEKKIINLPETKSHWLNLMINNQTNEIIGKYDGYIDVDKDDITYNKHSHIKIIKEFRGKGLCKDFAKNTYDNVAKKLKVKYFRIFITAKNVIGACHCYTKAANELEYKISVNGKTIESYDQCKEIYSNVRYTPEIVFNVENPSFYYF